MKDRITQRELADACLIEPATLSRALDCPDMGYIHRQENPGCRRSYLVALTEEGNRVAEQVQQIFREIEEQMTQGFSEEEMEMLLGLMNRIYENLS